MATLAEGANFTAINAGKFADILTAHKGKLFLKDLIKSTGCDISLSALPPNGGVPILHAHKANEEIYIITSGEGQYLVDGQIFPITEGSVIRVAPAGQRCMRNTSSTSQMTYICIQVKAGSIGPVGMGDAEIPEAKPEWK